MGCRAGTRSSTCKSRGNAVEYSAPSAKMTVEYLQIFQEMEDALLCKSSMARQIKGYAGLPRNILLVDLIAACALLFSLLIALMAGMRVVTNMVALVYPAWQTLKALNELPNNGTRWSVNQMIQAHEDDTYWLCYWLFYSFVTLVECSIEVTWRRQIVSVTDVVLWIPMYEWLKMGVYVFMWSPYTKGAYRLYRLVVEPRGCFRRARFNIAVPHASFTGGDVGSWHYSKKHGIQAGVAVLVSGAGAWARLTGNMEFEIKHLDDSKTYKEMKKSYDIDGGVHGFLKWIGFGGRAQKHQEEITKVFNEVSNQQDVKGSAHFDLWVTGQYPNVEVTAQAYVFIMQITDSQGNTYNIASDSDPAGDTGAQDGNGKTLPSKDNNSTISL